MSELYTDELSYFQELENIIRTRDAKTLNFIESKMIMIQALQEMELVQTSDAWSTKECTFDHSSSRNFTTWIWKIHQLTSWAGVKKVKTGTRQESCTTCLIRSSAPKGHHQSPTFWLSMKHRCWSTSSIVKKNRKCSTTFCGKYFSSKRYVIPKWSLSATAKPFQKDFQVFWEVVENLTLPNIIWLDD